MEEAFLARASATILPEQLTWLKRTDEKLESKCHTSSTIFPKEDSIEVPWETVEIIVAESPSNITYKLTCLWMWWVGSDHLITEYLNCLFIISDTSICILNVVNL